ncbi:MAG: hypothetical protein ACXABO_21190 [Promethearchaeota archaeon]|jgi:hypothetical protein
MSDNFSSTNQVGYKEVDFIIWHHSTLTAEIPFFEIVTGDPLLVKVKLTDIDVNSFIAFTNVRLLLIISSFRLIEVFSKN